MATSPNQDQSTLERRLARIRSQMEGVKKRKGENYQFSREWFDLYNEEAEIQSALRRRSGGPSAQH